ncbi:MAG: hypothetical protein JXK07_15390 [Spirochaetes bacterium]|nr:hypothetical protein [Spirochaetota bacterium]MBN2769350.1 hypothetical protein [Spirochaetota bacterium]
MSRFFWVVTFVSVFLTTNCSTDFHDLADHDKKTQLNEDPDNTGNPSILIRADYLSEVITNNSTLPTTPVSATGSTELLFQIKNTKDSILTINNITTDSSSFLCMEDLPITLEHDMEHQFTLKVNSPGSGNTQAKIIIESNDPEIPTFQFTVDINALTSPVYVSAAAPANGNGTYSNPYKSLNDAINSANQDGTIVLGSGSYNGCFEIDKPIKLLGHFRFNGEGWKIVPEDQTDGRPVLHNNSAAASDSTVCITATTLSSEISLTSLNIYTPNASADASTVLIDSGTTSSGAINIRNCNISNPYGYNSTGSSAAIRLTNGTQSGTVSITDSFIQGGDGSTNAWGICFNDDSLSLNGFSFTIKRNDIAAGKGNTPNKENAGIEISSINSPSTNIITNTTIDISDNERICGPAQSTNSNDHGIYIKPLRNSTFSNSKLYIQNNGIISAGPVITTNAGYKYGIRFRSTNMPTNTSGSVIIIQNNEMIRSHNADSTGQPLNITTVFTYSTDTDISVKIYNNHIIAETFHSDVSRATAISCDNFKNFECINNIITSELSSGNASRGLYLAGGNNNVANVYNNLIYVLGVNGGDAIFDYYQSPDSVNIKNNIIMLNNHLNYCIFSYSSNNRFIQNNYLHPHNNYFYQLNSGTSYNNISSFETDFSNCVNNFTGSSPIFDSNWRLTSDPANSFLKTDGTSISGVASDIDGNPRPGSDGAYAVGPYEY